MSTFGSLFLFIASLVGYIHCGQQCLSCNGIANPFMCRETITCHPDEVCYMHNYTTENNVNHFDFGCYYPELCPGGSGLPPVGKRADEGHHIVCQSCCNNTNICNMDLVCDHNDNGGGSLDMFPTECSEIKNINTNGVFTIYPSGPFKPTPVYCILDRSGIWTVIQRRMNGVVDFYRNWADYKKGFGSASTEYWLGNDNLHFISRSSAHEMVVVLEDFAGEARTANYSYVSIGDERHFYRLYVTEYTGTAGDTLSFANGMPYSTFDRDNQGHNCPSKHNGAWWYSTCGYSNLNGEYLNGHTENLTGMFWYAWHGFEYSYKETTMMIKRK
ncbi:Hypothetical predicted protein [Mytilus galloprovincialis]|uniref:Fibrinogen C-terminal domain-containing protein n=1 Tax=Mytilus galloprovincialis TaxID=29158 RepID=A0A8B6FMZ4_MYTGA|nr:Hypothetical predicted protein [Mytilus galloprovincialis]VDI51360.1 Hypothetical predicted protein [Mytilus galloprovincialis]